MVLLFVSMIMLALNVQPAEAQSQTVCINVDGSITPAGAPIVTSDRITYTFTGDISYPAYNGIIVQKSNITIDGKGYAVQGTGAIYGSIGIYMSSISNVTVKNANIEGFWYGIYVNLANYCSLYGNNLTTNSYGLNLVGSSNNVIRHNSVNTNEFFGITLQSSRNNTLTDNSMTGNGYNFAVWGASLLDFIQDADASNTVDGRSVCFWVNRQDAEVPLDAGYVALVNCSQITLKNLTLTSNGQKILIAYTYNSLILNVRTSGSKTFAYDFCDVFMYNSNRNIVANSYFGSNINLTLSNYNILKNNMIVGIYTMIMSSVGNLLQNNTVTNARWDGFIFWHSENNIIRNNTIYDNLNDGIWLNLQSENNTIESNNITQNGSGIVEDGNGSDYIRNNFIIYNSWDGIEIESNNNVVFNNTIVGNHARGIAGSDNTTISNNIITSNHEEGIFVESYNVIGGNTIANNSLGGLYVRGIGNVIQHNNFVSNSGQVVLERPDLGNVWDDGYPSGGNYWSDYNSTDLKSGPYQNETGSDGIGDTPYIINATCTDRYPLMAPFNTFDAGTWNGVNYNVDVVSNSTISAFGFNAAQKTITFNVTGLSGTMGFSRVTIPNALLSGPYTVLVNGLPPLTLNEVSNGTHTFLYFTYKHSTQQVNIIGTTAVPEFPFSTILPILMAISALALIFTKRKKVAKPKN
jgi:parallel beta-helix repeat protein